MTATPTTQDRDLPLAVEYVPDVRGHSVLAIGADADGAEAVAAWRLGPTGWAGGAWVIPIEDMERDPEPAIRIFGSLDGRCLVDWTAERPLGILDRIRGFLPPRLVLRLTRSVLLFPDVIREIAEHRQRYAEQVTVYRATTNSKIADLSWSREVPLHPGPDQDGFAVRPAGAASPVAADALARVRALEQIVELWQNTEQARHRRPYLRSLDEPQPLPPRWLASLRAGAIDSEQS